MANTETHLVHIACRVPPVVAKRMAELAAAAKTPLSTYAAQLLIAAYSARVKPPTGDRNLDAAVARIAILWAEKRNTADVAAAVGLSEPTVIRVLDAWRAEVSMGRSH